MSEEIPNKPIAPEEFFVGREKEMARLKTDLDNVIAGQGWAKARDRYLQTYRNVCGWHEKIGFDEMTDHRVLSPDRLVHETRFSSGWTVVVNFGVTAWRDDMGVVVQPEGYEVLRIKD